MTDDWISAETEGKEADFRGILAMHATLCKGIMRRQGASPYLYVDLYAGPGHLEYRGRRFLGSPLIAQDILTRAGFAYETVHFERDPEVAARLAEALWTPTSLLDCPDAESAPIYAEDFRTAFPRWLDKAGHQPEERREIVTSLREAGLSTRAIASATGSRPLDGQPRHRLRCCSAPGKCNTCHAERGRPRRKAVRVVAAPAGSRARRG